VSGVDFQELRAHALGEIETLARELVPDGRRNGGYWIGSNPTRADRHPGSFWIRLREPATGAFRDEAGVRGVDDGDVVRLVQYVLGHKSLSETRAWLLRRYGLAAGGPAPSEAEKAARAAKLKADAETREKQDAEIRDQKSRSAFGLWLKAEKLTPANFPGSILDRYLKSRAIDLVAGLLERGRPLPGALRFFASHDYLTADGELLAFPCLAALMSSPDGKGQALHRTWLATDGSGKAVLPDPDNNGARKIWGPPNGAVIRLSKGAGELSPEEASRRGRRGPLVVGEGIETCLPIAIALPDRRVWAAGTLGNVANVPILSCVSSITVAADNDWTKPQAVAGFERALAQLKARARAQGVPVAVARARGDAKDFNDRLKGERI
jgi:hypothetical protein